MAKKPSGKAKSFVFFHQGQGHSFGEEARESSDLLTAEKFYQPALDIYETRDSIRIEIELPGVSASEIELYSIGDTIYLKANKYDPEPIGSRSGSGRLNFVCMERKFGRFRRKVELPTPGNTQAAEAVYRDGVLRVDVPKVPDRRGKRVNIRIKEEK